ncbi:MAG TPA: hypothetical protein PKD86_12860 [Gemmatales bacterium]|nr:hypothetical protein [Gemmatales bacterium]HMP60234.1 hypothetical protein [Gemmatales bacterium]
MLSRHWKNSKRWGVSAAGLGTVVVVLLFIRLIAPRPEPITEQRFFLFHQEQAARHLLMTRSVHRGRWSRNLHPHRLTWKAAQDPVDIYVVVHDVSDVAAMMRMTTDLAEGQAPAGAPWSQLQSKEGEILLPRPWMPFARVSYLVLLRGPEGNEVQFICVFE